MFVSGPVRFPDDSAVKNLPAKETWVRSLGQEKLLKEEMATHSSILAWKISWAEETGRLQTMAFSKSIPQKYLT